MRKVLLVFGLFIWLIAACAPEAAATEEPATVDESSTRTPIPVDLTPAQLAAVNTLSKNLGVPVDEIKLASTEEVEWPDGCLGIVRIGVMCTQATVPGFKIILEANGKKYEYHTNQDGSMAVLAEGAQEAGAVEHEVIKQLAANLGLQESDISIVSNEAVEFGDACLGVAMPNLMCAQVITPGQVIVLEANGIQYEYHTSADGSRIQPATFALIWTREGGIAGFCDALTVFRSGEVYTSQCKGQAEGKMGTLASLLSANEQTQFQAWMDRLGEINLDASDPKGVADRMVITLNVFGMGDQQPTKSEQQALFEFAQNLYQKLNQ